jgi:hypothetical protein
LGVVPVQLLQKREIAAFVNWPLTLGVNVCPPHVVVVIPTPKPSTDSLSWSRF